MFDITVLSISYKRNGFLSHAKSPIWEAKREYSFVSSKFITCFSLLVLLVVCNALCEGRVSMVSQRQIRASLLNTWLLLLISITTWHLTHDAHCHGNTRQLLILFNDFPTSSLQPWDFRLLKRIGKFSKISFIENEYFFLSLSRRTWSFKKNNPILEKSYE